MTYSSLTFIAIVCNWITKKVSFVASALKLLFWGIAILNIQLVLRCFNLLSL